MRRDAKRNGRTVPALGVVVGGNESKMAWMGLIAPVTYIAERPHQQYFPTLRRVPYFAFYNSRIIAAFVAGEPENRPVSSTWNWKYTPCLGFLRDCACLPPAASFPLGRFVPDVIALHSCSKLHVLRSARPSLKRPSPGNHHPLSYRACRLDERHISLTLIPRASRCL